MKSLNIKILVICSIIITGSFVSCIQSKFDEPEVNTIPIGKYLTIDQLYQIHIDSVLLKSKTNYIFKDDYSVNAVVSMDDKSGNIYKSAFVQDGSKGINLHLMSSGGLYQGDSIRINLKGLVLSLYSGMMQLDSVYVDKHITKLSTHKSLVPEKVTIDQIKTGQYLAKLIKLEDVQFTNESLDQTYADAENLITKNRTLIDATNQTIIVRTSGYASFAKNEVPKGRGSFVAVVSKFNEEWQLYIRSMHEVNFNKRRFGVVDTILFEDFKNVQNNINIDIPMWNNFSSIAEENCYWKGFNNNEVQYAKINGTKKQENYLVLPQKELNNSFISFKTRAGNLVGAKLELVVSTNYNSNMPPQDAIWSVVNANIATSAASGYGAWAESGMINLSQYNGTPRFAFRFSCENGQKGEFHLDDIMIYNE